jgi:hypothetical protein
MVAVRMTDHFIIDRRPSPVRLPRGSTILTPKARAPFAIIEQVRSLLGHCMSLTGTGTSEMRAQASHGRRKASSFGASGWAIEHRARQ